MAPHTGKADKGKEKEREMENVKGKGKEKEKIVRTGRGGAQGFKRASKFKPDIDEEQDGIIRRLDGSNQKEKLLRTGRGGAQGIQRASAFKPDDEPINQYDIPRSPDGFEIQPHLGGNGESTLYVGRGGGGNYIIVKIQPDQLKKLLEDDRGLVQVYKNAKGEEYYVSTGRGGFGNIVPHDTLAAAASPRPSTSSQGPSTFTLPTIYEQIPSTSAPTSTDAISVQMPSASSLASASTQIPPTSTDATSIQMPPTSTDVVASASALPPNIAHDPQLSPSNSEFASRFVKEAGLYPKSHSRKWSVVLNRTPSSPDPSSDITIQPRRGRFSSFLLRRSTPKENIAPLESPAPSITPFLDIRAHDAGSQESSTASSIKKSRRRPTPLRLRNPTEGAEPEPEPSSSQPRYPPRISLSRSASIEATGGSECSSILPAYTPLEDLSSSSAQFLYLVPSSVSPNASLPSLIQSPTTTPSTSNHPPQPDTPSLTLSPGWPSGILHWSHSIYRKIETVGREQEEESRGLHHHDQTEDEITLYPVSVLDRYSDEAITTDHHHHPPLPQRPQDHHHFDLILENEKRSWHPLRTPTSSTVFGEEDDLFFDV